jgi:acyl-CoA synthetase (AMP-forming)/AMP-acid ligase II
VTAEEVIAHCKKQMTAYKVPRQVIVRDELPKSPIGKVLRRELREASLPPERLRQREGSGGHEGAAAEAAEAGGGS